MISIMEIDGYKAVIKYDPEIGMFRVLPKLDRIYY